MGYLEWMIDVLFLGSFMFSSMVYDGVMPRESMGHIRPFTTALDAGARWVCLTRYSAIWQRETVPLTR